MRRAWGFLVLPALLFAATPGLGRASEPVDPWPNPFCSASVDVIPWDDAAGAPAKQRPTRTFLMSLTADGRANVAGNVTLIADEGAYSVTVPKTALLRQGGTDNFYAEPMLVRFDKPADVRYAYVDKVGVDSADPEDCPTVVSRVDPIEAGSGDAPSGDTTGLRALPATFLQALPALSCGRAYIPPGDKNVTAPVGHFGDRRLVSTVRVYIDSNGQALKETLEHSSGVDGVDAAALGAVARGTYKAAQFLCTPVVSEMTFDMVYQP